MRRRPGDWDCPKCQQLVFSFKPQCKKCGTYRPNPSITNEEWVMMAALVLIGLIIVSIVFERILLIDLLLGAMVVAWMVYLTSAIVKYCKQYLPPTHYTCKHGRLSPLGYWAKDDCTNGTANTTTCWFDPCRHKRYKISL